MASFILVHASSLESRLADQLAKLKRLGFKTAVLGSAHRQDKHDPLTPRQSEILREMTMGLRTKEIARKLNVSIKTVETHRLHLMERLGIRSIPRLVRYALQNGVLPASWLLEGIAVLV